MRSVADVRRRLDDKLSATLRRDAEDRLAGLYEDAKYQAELAMEEYDEAEAAKLLPAQCPYSLDQILQKRWYTDPVEKRP